MGLSSIKITTILLLKVNDKVNIIPNIMVKLIMVVEPLSSILIQSVFIQTTHKTNVFLIIFFKSSCLTQLRKRINNNTEHYIQNNSCDDEEERDVEEELDHEVAPIPWLNRCRGQFTDTATVS